MRSTRAPSRNVESFDALLKEIQRSLGAYGNDFKGQTLSQVLCTGGGLLSHGLLRHLQTGA